MVEVGAPIPWGTLKASLYGGSRSTKTLPALLPPIPRTGSGSPPGPGGLLLGMNTSSSPVASFLAGLVGPDDPFLPREGVRRVNEQH